MSPEHIESFYRLPTPDEIEVRWPGGKASRGTRAGDYLFQVKADATHKHTTWSVRLRPARGGKPERWTTGCRVEELELAKHVYLAFLIEDRNRAIGRTSPKARIVTDALKDFLALSAARFHDGHEIVESTLDRIINQVERLVPFFDGWRVGDLDKQSGLAYTEWAKRPSSEGGGGFAHNTVCGILWTMRQALEWTLNTDEVYYKLPFAMPKWEMGSKNIFSPQEVDRVPIAAATGRIWDAEKGDWKRRLDPQTGEMVFELRRLVERRAGEPYGRLFDLGIVFGSRPCVHLEATWTDCGKAWIDIDRGVFHRLGSAQEETSKRRGYCPIPPKFLPKFRAWRDADVARGIDHVVHGWDGTEIAESSYGVWYALLEAAGSRKLKPHACKDTCVQIMRLGDVSLYAAAEFLCTRPDTLIARYGRDWDIGVMTSALEALGEQRGYRAKFAEQDELVAAMAEARRASPPRKSASRPRRRA